jgi:hypothetical protein
MKLRALARFGAAVAVFFDFRAGLITKETNQNKVSASAKCVSIKIEHQRHNEEQKHRISLA